LVLSRRRGCCGSKSSGKPRNELANIFDRLGIPTQEVPRARVTKWNFLTFTPGLVGGHWVGVDRHYLTVRAEPAAIIRR
jgi:UDP-N-acetyl-D-mannosaminuronate dehydrogenase